MHTKRYGMTVWLFISIFLGGWAAHGVTDAGPFIGSLQESWEAFPNYGDDPDFFMDNPTAIMGGAATISNPSMIIYEPGVAGANFNLGLSGDAQVADGAKGMGIDDEAQTTTIDFATPVSSLGGYWGTATGEAYPDPNTVFLDFFDGANNLIDSKTFTYSRSGTGRDGLLEWHGWSSTVPIQSLTYTGDYVVNDALQANPGPEASIYLLFSLGALGLMVWRRRKK